jgi:hypothetical protein
LRDHITGFFDKIEPGTITILVDFAHDTSVYSLGDKPQHVYSVRFSARDLWGAEAMPQDAVYVDMWDDYLEPA